MDSYNFLKHLIVFMKTNDDAIKQATGTGFFVTMDISGKQTPLLATATHVANEMKKADLTLHYKDSKSDLIHTVTITVSLDWTDAKDKDISVCKLDKIKEKIKKITGCDLYYTSISKENILTEAELKDIQILSEVIMVGYPSGCSSTHGCYPIFRKGYLASKPEDNFENEIGYVDIVSTPGSSGSPLFLNNSSKLIGIMSKVVMENPLSSADLGMYVDGYHLLELKKELKEDKEDKKKDDKEKNKD